MIFQLGRVIGQLLQVLLAGTALLNPAAPGSRGRGPEAVERLGRGSRPGLLELRRLPPQELGGLQVLRRAGQDLRPPGQVRLQGRRHLARAGRPLMEGSRRRRPRLEVRILCPPQGRPRPDQPRRVRRHRGRRDGLAPEEVHLRDHGGRVLLDGLRPVAPRDLGLGLRHAARGGRVAPYGPPVDHGHQLVVRRRLDDRPQPPVPLVDLVVAVRGRRPRRGDPVDAEDVLLAGLPLVGLPLDDGPEGPGGAIHELGDGRPVHA